LNVRGRGLVLALGCLAASCTQGGATTTPTRSPDQAPGRAMPATVTVERTTFDVSCTPVAEALIDIELPHAGEPKIRAVAGLWDQQAVAVLEKAAKAGIVIVRSTRLPTGLVLRNNEINDDKMGFVASGEFTAPKSRVLLQLALTKTQDPARIQKMFDVY